MPSVYSWPCHPRLSGYIIQPHRAIPVCLVTTFSGTMPSLFVWLRHSAAPCHPYLSGYQGPGPIKVRVKVIRLKILVEVEKVTRGDGQCRDSTLNIMHIVLCVCMCVRVHVCVSECVSALQYV